MNNNLTAEAPNLSVVIATYNREELLIDTLRSVLTQDYPARLFEIIIVDQTSVPGSKLLAFLETNSTFSLRYFHCKPPNLPAARNFGCVQASGNIIVFVDDDVVLEPRFLRAYEEAFMDPSIDAVGGRVVNDLDENGSNEPVQVVKRITFAGAHVGSFNSLIDQDCTILQGCNMAFRSRLLSQIGGFDTRFVGNAYREESDVCYTLRARGCRLAYRTSPSLRHLCVSYGGCRGLSPLKMTYQFYQNETLFFLKHQKKRLLVKFFVCLIMDNASGRDVAMRQKLAILRVLIVGVLGGIVVYLRKCRLQSELCCRGDCRRSVG